MKFLEPIEDQVGGYDAAVSVARVFAQTHQAVVRFSDRMLAQLRRRWPEWKVRLVDAAEASALMPAAGAPPSSKAVSGTT